MNLLEMESLPPTQGEIYFIIPYLLGVYNVFWSGFFQEFRESKNHLPLSEQVIQIGCCHSSPIAF